jgi:protein-S-isoprenylcysteine O-methyltransferase Ste14
VSAGAFWQRWRVRAGYPVALVYVVLAEPAWRSLLLGGALAAVGVLVRARAAGHLRKQEALATSGPYAYTRNPLYFGSAFLAAGFVVAGGSAIAGLLVAAYFAAFYAPVMLREARDLRSLYGAAYDDYAARVPLFWPRITPGVKAPGGFSWELYRRNREYKAALGTVLGLLLLWAKMLWDGPYWMR